MRLICTPQLRRSGTKHIKMDNAMLFISLEDHFVSSVCETEEVASTLDIKQFPPPVLSRLVDVGEQRIAAMESGQVGLQIVSHVPIVLSVENCRTANDELAERVRKSNSRLAAFATLPMGQPNKIAAELERCCRSLGFLGALVPNHADGVYYDGEDYRAFWAMAEKLQVPVYLHPCPPPRGWSELFSGNYSTDIDFAVSTHAWDWHANCGLHFVRLYASGLFDESPALKLVFDHLGELVPFMLGRIERKLALTKDSSSWKSSVQQVWARNVWVTTSGMFDVEAFELTRKVTALDRIMFSVDYPFESTVQSTTFMHDLQSAGVLSSSEMAQVAYGTAQKLLRI